MKKIYILFSLLVGSSFSGFGQCSVTVTSHTNVSCNGFCDGTVQLTTLGVPNFTYSWAPGGQTVQNPTDLCAGTHTVTMTDANSCQSTATVQITQPSPLTSTTSTQDVTCHGVCNGSATATASGGTLFYSYQWDSTANNQATSTASGLCAGTYSVTITDGNGCTTTNTATVTEPNALTINTTSNAPSCSACTDGSATAMVNGGTPSYDYLWQPTAQTTATAVNLAAGTYTVDVTDAQGCTISDTVMVGSVTGVTWFNGFSIHTYPNPTNNFFFIEMMDVSGTAHVSVKVYDATGRTVQYMEYAATKGNVKQFNLEGQPAGLYFAEIAINGATMTQKVIKR